VLFAIDPLVPVTVTVNVLTGTEQAKAMKRLDVADPPEGTLTLVELKVTVTPAGTLELVSTTVPEKPPKLVNVMVDVPNVPVATVREDGLALILIRGRLTMIVFDVPTLPA
jgi:hypothetical protein